MPKHFIDARLGFNARNAGTNAGMRPGSETEMRIVFSSYIEDVGIAEVCAITIGSAQDEHQGIRARERAIVHAELHLGKARHRLYRPLVAQNLLHSRPDQAGMLLQFT